MQHDQAFREWAVAKKNMGMVWTQLKSCILWCTPQLLFSNVTWMARGSEHINSSHLMALETCKQAVGEYSSTDKFPHCSPPKVEFWYQVLASHPDCYYVACWLEGMANSFRISFNHRFSLYLYSDNICQLKIISEYLEQEV